MIIIQQKVKLIECDFKEIQVSKCFMYLGRPYLRIKDINNINGSIAIDMTCGELITFQPDYKVKPIESKLIIYSI